MGAAATSKERRLAAAALLAAVAAAVVAFSPSLVAATVGVAVFPFLLRSALLRTGFLTVGGLVTLQSGVDRLTADKIVYALGVCLAAGIAGAHLLRRRAGDEFEPLRTLWPLLAGISLLCLVSAPVALANDVAANDWLRDASSYALLALVPLFVSDLVAEVGDWRAVGALLGPLAAASTVSFTLEWLYHRKIVSFDASIGLPSFLFPAALLAFAVSAALLGYGRRARVISLAVGVAVLALLLSTGTRSALILFAGVGPPLVGLLAGDRRPSMRAVLVALAAFVVVVGSLIAVLGSTQGRIADRLRDIPDTIVQIESDPSYQIRADAWRRSWDTFTEHPLVGVGAGYRFKRELPGGGVSTQGGYNVDSPLGFLAKFGLVGLALLALGAFSVARFLASTRTRSAAVPWYAALGFAAIILAFVPLGVPIEDKGSSFGLLGLLAMTAASARSRRGEAVGPLTDVEDRPQPTPPPRRPRVVEALEPHSAGSGRRSLRSRERMRYAASFSAGLLVALLAVGAYAAVADDGESEGSASTTTAASVDRPKGDGKRARETREARWKRLAEARTRQWLYTSCGPSCDEVKLVSGAEELWELHVRYPDGMEVCHALDLSQFERAASYEKAVRRISCTAFEEAKELTVERQRAMLTIRRWAYLSCGVACPLSGLRRVSGRLWEFSVRYGSGARCFLVDTEQFVEFRSRVGGVWGAACRVPASSPP